ncbi:MAG TPA: hypothetical protein VFV52_15720 [Bacilli bacterium]|nr:hypothetical protein [Bacilli bacterium]
MLQQGTWTFRYSLSGFLKRALFVAQAPCSEEELVAAVMEKWAGPDEQAPDAIAGRVRASLTMAGGAFAAVEEDKFTLRQTGGEELLDLAHEFLRDTLRPQKNGEILRYLQQATGRGRGELMSRVDLDSDPRFARLEGGEWLLTAWEPANEAIVQLMVEMGQRRADRADLLGLIEEEAPFLGKQIIFHPELDPRFAVIGEQVDCLLVEDEAAATTEAPEEATLANQTEGSTMNETASMETEVTESNEATATDASCIAGIPTSQLVDAVLAQLNKAAGELGERNEQLPNEVLTLFNSDDLQGIEKLMLQRKRIAALAEDLQAVVAKWSDEIDA